MPYGCNEECEIELYLEREEDENDLNIIAYYQTEVREMFRSIKHVEVSVLLEKIKKYIEQPLQDVLIKMVMLECDENVSMFPEEDADGLVFGECNMFVWSVNDWIGDNILSRLDERLGNYDVQYPKQIVEPETIKKKISKYPFQLQQLMYEFMNVKK